jgi:hypothetical protein
MKSLIKSIYESMVKLNTKKISGTKYVKAASKEYGVEEDIKSSTWKKTTITPGDITVYWNEEGGWCFYYYGDSKRWAAVASATGNNYSEEMFKDFDGLCMEGATIPEFDKFETNLE